MKGANFLTAALNRETHWGMSSEHFEALRAIDTGGRLPELPVPSLSARVGVPGPGQEGKPEEGASADAALYDPQVSSGYLTVLLKETTPDGKAIALINFTGTIISRAPYYYGPYGYLNPQLFAATMQSLADNASVGAVVIVMDCNGGTVTGTQDAADAVAYAAKKKRGKVYALASDMMLSAAYWIGSQASQVIASPTALVGSIGVITNHIDYSKAIAAAGIVVTVIRSVVNKARGQPYEPLSPEALAERQAMVNALHETFVQAVSGGRGVAKTQVAKNWAGSVFIGGAAVTAGLADRTASLGTILAELTGKQAPPAPPSAAVQTDPDGEGEEDAGDEGPEAKGVGVQTPEPVPGQQAPASAAAEGTTATQGAEEEKPDAPAPEVTHLALNAEQPYTFYGRPGVSLALHSLDGQELASAGLGMALEYTPEAAETVALHATHEPTEGLSSAEGGQGHSVGVEKTSASEETAMKIEDIRAKVAAGTPITAEEQAALTAHFDAQRKASAGGGVASVDRTGLPASVVKALDDAQAHATGLQKQLDARDEEAAQAAAEKKVAELGQPASFAATYRKVSTALAGDPTALAAYEQSVRATAAQEKLGVEIGSAHKTGQTGGTGAGTPQAGGVEGELRAKADAEMKANSALSYRAACDEVFKKDRAFAIRYARGG